MIDTQLFQEYSPELYDLAKAIAEEYRNEIRKSGAVASGDLLHFNWDVQLTETGLTLVFFLPSYWRYTEFGRRETKGGGNGAVYKAILKWIDEKGITPTARTIKSGKNAGKKYTPTKKQLAYMITRKIHAVGYYGRTHYGKNQLSTAMQNSQSLMTQFTQTAAKIFTGQIETEILKLDTTADVEVKL